MGRPTNNLKDTRLQFRFDKETLQKLDICVKIEKTTWICVRMGYLFFLAVKSLFLLLKEQFVPLLEILYQNVVYEKRIVGIIDVVAGCCFCN